MRCEEKTEQEGEDEEIQRIEIQIGKQRLGPWTFHKTKSISFIAHVFYLTIHNLPFNEDILSHKKLINVIENR